MSNMKIVTETPLSMVDLKEKLANIKKRDKELGNRSTKAEEYLGAFVKLDKKQTEELTKKLLDLSIPRLREKHVSKVIDIMPKDMDSLKVVLSGDNLTIKQEDLEKILEVIK